MAPVNARSARYATAAEKTVGVGGRLDNQLARIRVCFFHDDLDLAKEYIGKAEIELAKGAEWERRNKLKARERFV